MQVSDNEHSAPDEPPSTSGLAERERRQRALLLHMSDVLVVTSADGTLIETSPSAGRILGYGDRSQIGRSVLELVDPADRAVAAEALARIAEQPGVSPPMRLRLLLADGGSRHFEARANNLLADPEIAGIVMVASDVTEQHRVESSQRSQARVLELIASEAPVAVILEALVLWVEQELEDTVCTVMLTTTGPDGTVLHDAASPGMPDAYREQVEGLPTSSDYSPCAQAVRTGEPVIVPDLFAEDRWQIFHDLAAQCDVRACWSFPVRSPANGKVLGTFALYQRQPGLPGREISSLIDRASHLVGITVDRQHLLARLAHQADHDALTGLPNRTLLLEHLTAALDPGNGRPGPVVVFLDLDRLKIVNDSLGHELGDEMLVTTATRLRAAIPPEDVVARFGGDEFVVLARRTGDPDQAARLAEHILATIAAPVRLEDRLITPSGSAGVVVASPGEHATDVLRDADIAMYRAKHRGGSGYEIFDAGMRQRAFDRLDLEEQIRRGLSAGEFRVFYQPVTDLTRDDLLVGFEALVRWQHPERGLLAPAAFIELAEETGLIVPLGEWVLRTAAATVRTWAERFEHLPLTLSVNLAAKQLSAPGLLETVRESMATLAPWSLALELTESTLMDGTANARGVIADLAGTGVLLSIDDFGAGFSSLGYLTRLPVTTLKIDRSFVIDLEDKPEAVTVASMVISLGAALGLTVIAEGIETVGQRQILLDMGCRYGQGYLFGRPLPSDAASALLAAKAVPDSGG
jgi:diguanylate cyclase (GGDEF)-like protein/PAS domain S-box-containing protein